jgi:6-oxocyclohex-1-ene-1-carbonyl-CoA hydrolase
MKTMKQAFESQAAETFIFEEIKYSKADYVATIMINRPQSYNAYSTTTLRELAEAFQDAAFDDAVGVIVFTGSGDRAFCTGGDVKEYERDYTRSPHNYWKYMRLFEAYLESIMNTGKPVIARINGMAVGGGNESQLACDLAIMAEHAYLGQVGTNVGSVACGGATQWLPITVGDRRAREMLMLNRPVSARRALEWGLVNQVVSTVMHDGSFVENATDEEIEKATRQRDGYSIDLSRLDQEVQLMCQELLRKFVECTRYTKQQVNFLKEFTWHQTVGHGRDWLSTHYACREPIEGMRAFVEKRRPDYMGLRAMAARGSSPELMWGAYTLSCAKCGVDSLPEDFSFCGKCGGKLGV